MTKTEETVSSEIMAAIAIKGIQEKKGSQIVRLNLTELDQAIADYFVICHASSTTQVSAIADSVEEQMRLGAGEKPLAVEGKQNGEWILIDFGNIMVHVFQKEFRGHYALEDLWADAIIDEISEE